MFGSVVNTIVVACLEFSFRDGIDLSEQIFSRDGGDVACVSSAPETFSSSLLKGIKEVGVGSIRSIIFMIKLFGGFFVGR